MDKSLYPYFDQLEDRHWWFRARRKILMAFVGRYCAHISKPKILDIGCGTGAILKELASLGETWGVDNDDQALRFSARRAPSAHFVLGSFPDNLKGLERQRFDCITLFDVLEHIEEDESALRAIKTYLRPNGLLFITVPAYQWLWTKYDDETHHKRRYSKHSLIAVLETAGYRIEKISYFNSLLFPAVALVKIVSATFSLDTAHPRIVPASPLNSVLEKIFGLEKYLLPFLAFPFGVSIIVVARLDKHE